MRPRAPHGVLRGALCLALCCLCGALGLWKSGNHEWKKLIMVHHWPTTVCMEIENDCQNAPDYWTIHGLWPDKSEECNRSWHFNLDEIKDLLPDMKIYWPDVTHPPNHSHFWSERLVTHSHCRDLELALQEDLASCENQMKTVKTFCKTLTCNRMKHEWEKHGTCAAQLDVLNSQKKYFGKSLDLYKELALNSMLQKLGIKPSLNYYQISDIKDALASVYGVIPKVQCLPPRQGEEVQTLGQIELCLTKGLQLRNCTEPRETPSRRREARPARAAGEGPGLEVCEDGPAFYPPPEETNH